MLLSCMPWCKLLLDRAPSSYPLPLSHSTLCFSPLTPSPSANISLLLIPCLVSSVCQVMLLSPSLPSAVTFQFQTGWAERSYLSSQLVTLVSWGRRGSWRELGRGCVCACVNGHRVMHGECPYYANELQQPLSYVPQNELWLALMANFA